MPGRVHTTSPTPHSFAPSRSPFRPHLKEQQWFLSSVVAISNIKLKAGSRSCPSTADVESKILTATYRADPFFAVPLFLTSPPPPSILPFPVTLFAVLSLSLVLRAFSFSFWRRCHGNSSKSYKLVRFERHLPPATAASTLYPRSAPLPPTGSQCSLGLPDCAVYHSRVTAKTFDGPSACFLTRQPLNVLLPLCCCCRWLSFVVAVVAVGCCQWHSSNIWFSSLMPLVFLRPEPRSASWFRLPELLPFTPSPHVLPFPFPSLCIRQAKAIAHL